MSRTATPQGISRLLASAGYPRSNHGKPGVSYDQVSTGFVCWKTHHVSRPEQPYVAVQYNVAGIHAPDDDWDGYLRLAMVMLGKYAETLRGAGYHPLVRDRGQEPPWLTILTVAAED